MTLILKQTQSKTQAYWDRMREVVCSPKFHLFFLNARFKANFIDAPFYRRLMSIAFAIIIISIVTITHTWLTFLVAWVFPLTILYHISALCQIASEHLWGSTGSKESKSHGRFCGEQPPQSNDFSEWSIWWCKMLFYHLPVRLAIFSDPSIGPHDNHHEESKDDRDGANAIYNRQRQVQAGKEYCEYWGLHNAMEAVFLNLAEQAPLSDEEIDRLINS